MYLGGGNGGIYRIRLDMHKRNKVIYLILSDANMPYYLLLIFVWNIGAKGFYINIYRTCILLEWFEDGYDTFAFIEM